MDTSSYSFKLKLQMEDIKNSMVDPGYSTWMTYREALARYAALKQAHQLLKLATQEEDET